MDQSELKNRNSEYVQEEEPSRGPSLVVLYSCVALALLLALACAAMIVLPFYLRR